MTLLARLIFHAVGALVAVLKGLASGRYGASMKVRRAARVALSRLPMTTIIFLMGAACGIVTFSYFSSGFVSEYARNVCGSLCAANMEKDLGDRTITYAFLDWIFLTDDTSARLRAERKNFLQKVCPPSGR